MKQMDFDERVNIQRLLSRGRNFTQIAEALGRSRTTIGREVSAHRYKQNEDMNPCENLYKCDRKASCFHSHTTCNLSTCPSGCRRCITGCAAYREQKCTKLLTAPYVCNGCERIGHCRFNKVKYEAKKAQAEYEALRSESRKGVSLKEDEYEFLKTKVVPLLKRGVSVPAVCRKYAAEMPVSEKTLYKYISQRMFDMDNLDLRLVVRRKQTAKRGPRQRVDKKCHEGRCYEDFEAYTELNPKLNVCEIDSVEGNREGKCLLTIFFRNCDLQLMYIRQRNTAASVTEIFQELREKLGDDYRRLFPIVLSDRGTEFTYPEGIETNLKTGEIETQMFYCDPLNTNQKSRCERNHELIRYFVPKGHTFNLYKQKHIDIMMNQVNSIPRPKLNMKTPYELFEEIYGAEVLEKLGLQKIKFESLNLRQEAILPKE